LSKLTKPLIKSFAMRLERVIDTCQGGHRLEQARLLVSKEIDARLGGKSVPKIVLDLLDGGWRQLLVLTYLRQGNDNHNWQQELDFIDQLMNIIGADDLSAQHSQTHVLELKKFMLERLYSVGTEPSTPNRMADELGKLLMHDSKNKVIDYVTVPSSDTEREERDEQLRTRLQGFNIGHWLKFASEGNVWMPLRLTWIGQDPPRYVFVNQKGMKTLDLDAEKFVQMIDERRASRIESLEELTIVERAAKSLLYTLRERMR